MLLQNKLTTVALLAEFHVLEERKNHFVRKIGYVWFIFLAVVNGEERLFGLSFWSNLVKKTKLYS